MKKLISLILALVLCVALAAPAFAADNFVPSIAYKNGPLLISAEDDGGDVMGCMIITTIEDARDMRTNVPQEIRDALLDFYQKALENELEMPFDNNKYVIRELIDISFDEEKCAKAGHYHFPLTLTFDLGVSADDLIEVYTYDEEKLLPVKEVTNNGDGTVTCVFERLSPVAFVINRAGTEGNPNTGDDSAIGLYVALMALSLCAGAALLSLRKKA